MLAKNPPSQDEEELRELACLLQNAYIKDGAGDEWVRIRRSVLEAAVVTLKGISGRSQHASFPSNQKKWVQ
jgi:hypothetical protein